MGLKLGKLLRNAGTLGTTWMRDQRQAKKKKKKAAQLQEQMAAEAEAFADRDLGQTAFTGVQADPAMVAAQQQALQRTQQVANEGYTQTDRDAMQQQLRDAARYEQGQRQSLQQDAQARGMGGSGFNIQSQLAAQQAGADRATETATDMAIEGRNRSQQANQQVAQMAGGMRDQGFGEQATRAGATDQYGQWRANTQGQDFANLQAARAGTVAQMQAAAAEQESNPNLDYGVNAVANWYSGGLAGDVSGGGGGTETDTCLVSNLVEFPVTASGNSVSLAANYYHAVTISVTTGTVNISLINSGVGITTASLTAGQTFSTSAKECAYLATGFGINATGGAAIVSTIR